MLLEICLLYLPKQIYKTMSKTQVVTIEKGMPMPARRENTKASTVYPFEALEVGESFLAGEYSDKQMKKVSAASAYYQGKLDRKFSCRKTEEGFIRVWRTV